MTDYEELDRVLTRLGIEHKNLDAKGKRVIQFEEDEGYMFLYAIFEFTLDGKFLSYGLYK